ncbi:MAG: hypothetical protein KC619_16715 [Myxococcales bacterium]|nr:hypothetical protein [Myxococcales bacterium]
MRNGLLLGLGLLIVGCGGGSTADAGSGLDAGGGDDAGPMSVDAGDDAGPMSVDAGDDAGPMPVDAGDDAGPMSVDAGPDAGPPLDAGSDAGAPMDAGFDAAGRSPTGTMGCMSDTECAEGVCWDFSDYDSFCFGRICSLMCASDTDCQNAATTAGASNPSGARCGSDGKCDFVGAGLGAFACA